MALTSLKIKTNIEDVYQRIMISTHIGNVTENDGEPVLVVTVNHCDDTWTPKGEALIYYRSESEEEFHSNLRKEAAEKNQLITNMSTDPELNPEGYENIDKDLEVDLNHMSDEDIDYYRQN